jgi:pSer/pThr/pTyr-binding forkhead associated (FHA) protein
MIIEMGSNQFQAHFLDGVLTLEIIEGPSQGSMIEIVKNSKVTVGRKQTNALNFPDDQHLSNVHSTIFSAEGKYFIEDMGTTNGSWQRLSC